MQKAMIQREVMRQKGFSLVELAIAFVIIGLLIGGIVAGQSMITTSKVNALAMQVGQFDAGVESFKTKFNYLPGDAPSFGGDGNGVLAIPVGIGYNNNITVFGCEIANFWYSMDQQTYTSSACAITGTKAISNGAGKNVPPSKLGSNGSFIAASAVGIDNWNADTANPRNFYFILNASQAQNLSSDNHVYNFTKTGSTNSAVTPADLLAFDKKIDDGIANSGNVISGRIADQGDGSGGIMTGPPSTTICSNGATYLVTDSAYECTPLIRIGASVNDPQ